jgi:hypothetical protein
MKLIVIRRGVFVGVLVCPIIYLAACSKSEAPTPVTKTPAAPSIATPAPEPVVPPPPAPEPAIEQHIPGTPDAKAFVAANVAKQSKKHAANVAHAPDTAYDRAYRNALRADKLLHRHAYVVGFDDAAATNAVPLKQEYR